MPICEISTKPSDTGDVITNWAEPLNNRWFFDHRIYIFDLDGTIADIRHRLNYITGPEKDWDSFFKACVKDRVYKDIAFIIKDLVKANDTEIWIVSGRSSKVAKETIDWLNKHWIFFSKLFMRTEGDHRSDADLKEEWLNAIPWNIREKIQCVFEDRTRVVERWRQLGFTCLQVSAGDY